MTRVNFVYDAASNKVHKVALVGASGQQGSAIVAELQKHSQFEITALTRANAGSKLPAGVKVAPVDYSDHTALVKALQGQDVLIVTLSIAAPHDTESKLVDAAAEAGVAWVFHNSWGLDHFSDEFAKENLLGVGKKQVTDYIESKDLAGGWVGLACSFWTEWSLSPPSTDMFGIDIKNKKALLFSGGNQKISTSTWAQPARAIAALLSLPVYPAGADDKALTLSHWRNRYVLVESFNVTQRELSAAVLKATGEVESDWDVSEQPVEDVYAEGVQRLQAGDRSGFTKGLYSRCFYPDVRGNGNLRSRSAGIDNGKLGLPQESLDDVVRSAVHMSKDGYIESFFAKLATV